MSEYRARIVAALESGARFAGLHAAGDLVRTALVAPDGAINLEAVPVVDGRVPSIVDLAPAADWDEREAADLHGVRFDGHEPLRPLVDHDPDLDSWTVPVHGDDAYQVAVGPIHAGVIESGHFRFHVVGDLILHLDARLFYKHRGLERAAEGRTFAEGIAYAGRACAACAVANAVAYAQACEQILGLRPTAGCRPRPHDSPGARTALEPPQRHRGGLRRCGARRREHAVHRAHGARTPAECAADESPLSVRLDRRRRQPHLFRCRRRARRACGDSRRIGERLAGAALQRARSATGCRRSESSRARTALELGAVGPAARASGVAEDARATSERLAYDGFATIVPHRAAGDVQARLEQRALEVQQTFDLLASLLDRPVVAESCEPVRNGQTIGAARVESPRGATLCVVESANGRIGRLRLRSGSYANWPVVAHAAAANLLPDFPLINKSFELCYACADR